MIEECGIKFGVIVVDCSGVEGDFVMVIGIDVVYCE